MSTPFSDAGNAMFPPPEARLEVVRPRDEKELAAILRLAREAGTSVTAPPAPRCWRRLRRSMRARN